MLPGCTVPCPRCQREGVRVRQVEWQDGPYRRRSTWADEPLRCAWGCALTGEQVIRLLVAADRLPLPSPAVQKPYQLPLFELDRGEAA